MKSGREIEDKSEVLETMLKEAVDLEIDLRELGEDETDERDEERENTRKKNKKYIYILMIKTNILMI